MREFKYEVPKSLEELFAILNESKGDEVKYLAGGTDLMPRINLEFQEVPKESKKPVKIIYLGMMGFDKITAQGRVISIGACCKLNDIKKHPVIREKFPVLSETIHEMAGHTIRNTATLGGNIVNASPAADSIPTLFALDAEFILMSSNGVRGVKAAEFFTGPGKTVMKADEILTEVKISIGKGCASFKKLGRRQAETLSVVNAAAYIEMDNDICSEIRIAVGSVAPTVVRCKSVEKELQGKKLTADMIKEACAGIVNEINPIDDIRASAWYRNKVTPVMASRAIQAAAAIE